MKKLAVVFVALVLALVLFPKETTTVLAIVTLGAGFGILASR